ncbi:hypothetical protein A0109_RS04865 [Acinetobacter baumannii]|uniref:hypothetical protein n=1 Tax=Acinetobacter baumannii TaxID=470 RepID=UPI0007173101|nr:hypothetical protein [Acinetobacter baumannii]EHU1403005.1 hypothetical protein [Acinetobacter baumannii]EHU2218853.1 hypothetical protein [Acinetobacter baumannii]EHU2564545.1 hypothetical protein [Acinetobacter baumannii]EHU2789207.1 hypothetical protein [Acinetobacter baumannii]EHU3127791.1 hypothetical protein [Acinetobacter baumannii]
MDKPITFNEWLGTQGNMVLLHANCCRIAFEGGQQSMQAKVEELKASHHGEVIGHEVHFKKIKKERDELQTLYIQQGINMLKLQKRVDAAIEAINEHYESDGMSGLYFMDLKEILEGEQALNGDQYDEHRKKAEEAISKGASLTNHRIEL